MPDTAFGCSQVLRVYRDKRSSDKCPVMSGWCALQGSMGSVAGAAVELTRQMQSVQAAQELCDSLLSIPSPGGSFFQAAIGMELAVMPDSPHGITRCQRLFEVRSCWHSIHDLVFCVSMSVSVIVVSRCFRRKSTTHCDLALSAVSLSTADCTVWFQSARVQNFAPLSHYLA